MKTLRETIARWRSCVAFGLAVLWLPGTAQAQAFDFQGGNAPIDVIIPAVVPVIFASVDPGDATLVLRTTTLLTNAFFDAIAPYNPTAVGVYSQLGRRPAGEGLDDRARNIAIFYASLPVLNHLYPREQARWEELLRSVGLDPGLHSADLTRPEGIGRAAGLAVVRARERDGMNALGDAGPRPYFRLPFADTTGYQPVNTAYELRDPSRWQPAMKTRGSGLFTIQQFVTPQFAETLPYSYHSPAIFRVPPPVDSNPAHGGWGRYKRQADEVLNTSATLNDERKLTAELFNDKIRSLGFVALFLSQSRRWRVEQFVQYDFLVNLAAFDGGIATWQEKRRYDAVRPFSAIRLLYRSGTVQAWGGPGQGTVSLPGPTWDSYLGVADHPEYPSGSACFCAAHAQASRRFLGSDELNWVVPFPRGSSVIEPGVTPATDMTLNFPTWTHFESVCGQSRLWGGVHFQAAIDASKPVCKRIGNRAFRYVSALIAGRVTGDRWVDPYFD
jgi:hypothetical protein